MMTFTTQKYNYNFRYIEANEQVYVIQRHRRDEIMNLTIPFRNRESGVVQNSLMAFSSLSLANSYMRVYDMKCHIFDTNEKGDLKTNLNRKNNTSVSTHVQQMYISDVVRKALLIRMPLIVILNCYCSINTRGIEYELFYKP